jgi:hypothetical protein
MKQTAPLKDRSHGPKCIQCEKNPAQGPIEHPRFCSIQCRIDFAHAITENYTWDFDPDFGEYVWTHNENEQLQVKQCTHQQKLKESSQKP